MKNNKLPKILCLDDEQLSLQILQRLLSSRYDIFTTTSVEDAFDYLDLNPDISVIIADQRMPIITGVDFLEKTKMSHPESSRILITGHADAEALILAINKAQIFRYMTKPWDNADLINTVAQAVEKFSLKKSLEKTHSELLKVNEDLKNLDHVKNKFMMLINHELKTPLTTLLSFSELLKETTLTEEQVLFVDRMSKSGHKLKNIIDDVLLIVRGELGLIQPQFVNFKTEEILKFISTEVTRSIEAKDQKLIVSSELEDIKFDLELSLTALNRALHNATKFGAASSTIEVSIIKLNGDFSYGIDIKNIGPIISTHIIEKIMRPFQLDENIMNHSVGMGLGLSICQCLMKAQNADLIIANTQDGVKVQFKFRNTELESSY